MHSSDRRHRGSDCGADWTTVLLLSKAGHRVEGKLKHRRAGGGSKYRSRVTFSNGVDWYIRDLAVDQSTVHERATPRSSATIDVSVDAAPGELYIGRRVNWTRHGDQRVSA